MKLSFTQPFSNRKWSLLWPVGAGVVALVVLLLMAWLTRGGSAIESAMVAYQAGDVQGALDLFAQARDKNQINTAEEWNLFGNAYRDSKHLPEALEAYKKAIKIDSGYETAYRNLAYTATELVDQDSISQARSEAVGLIEKGRRSYPQSVFLVEDLIMLYGKTGDSAKVDELRSVREQLLAE